MNSKYIHILPILCFSLLNFQALRAQRIGNQIESIISPQVQEIAPGAAIAILKDQEVIFSKGYGFADLSHLVRFTPQTVSDIGSVAKQMTCYAILKIEAEGKLSIKNPITKYFPSIPALGDKITIEHLLTHTSGLREIYGMRAVAGGRGGDGILQEDALRLVEYAEELNFQPGEQYNYCNTAYMLLADIIAQVTEGDFEDYMRAHIFGPLDMKNTFIMDKQGEWFPNAALSYQSSEDGSFNRIFDNSTVQGAGGVYTTMEDLIKWAQHVIDPNFRDKDIIKRMKTPFTLNNGASTGYGYGLRIGDTFGYQSFGHTGSSAGYRAYLNHFDEIGITLLIKTNRTDLPLEQIVKSVLKHYGQHPLKDRGVPSTEEEVSDIVNNEDKMQSYIGRYYSPETEMSYTIELNDEQLIAKSLRNGNISLLRKTEYTFESDKWYFAELTFIESDNKIIGFRLGNGRVNGLWF